MPSLNAAPTNINWHALYVSERERREELEERLRQMGEHQRELPVSQIAKVRGVLRAMELVREAGEILPR